MTIRQKVLFCLCTILAIVICSIELTFWTNDYAKKPQIICQGVITERFENQYACGHYGDDICYARYFVLNNTSQFSVDRNAFIDYKIGDTIKLTTQVRPKHGAFVKAAQPLHYGIWIITAICLIVVGLYWLYWAIFYSDKYPTFKEFNEADWLDI